MSRPTFARYAAGLLGITLAINLAYVAACGDGLSPFADPYSEACVVRAGEAFAAEGYLKAYGLSNMTYGDKFAGEGIDGPSGSRPDDPIYQGYPPMSEWLGGLYTILLGPGKLGLYRIFPVGLSIVASAVFLAALAATVGRGRALAVYLACLAAPMFTGMSHGLYYEGYALSLMLIQVSLLMRIFGGEGPSRVGSSDLLVLSGLGFLQGWLSFDYCFIVTFAAVPIALAVGPRGGPTPWRGIVLACGASGLGFTAAHALHFYQSVLYMGGLREALAEYAFRSKKGYAARAMIEGMTRLEAIGFGLRRYLVVYLRWNHHLSLAGQAMLAALGATLLVTRLELAAGSRTVRASVRRPEMLELVGVASALVLALGWFFARPAHALTHLYFIGRHFFLFYLAGWLVVARAVSANLVPDADGDADDDGDDEAEEAESTAAGWAIRRPPSRPGVFPGAGRAR